MGGIAGRMLFGRGGGLGALGISPDFSGGRVSNGWTPPVSTPAPATSATSTPSGSKTGLNSTGGGAFDSKFNGTAPSTGGLAGSQGGKAGLLPIGSGSGRGGGAFDSKFNGTAPSVGGPRPGYDEDGQRSWDAGAEGYTPITLLPGGQDLRSSKDFNQAK